jgi:GTPase SAR1 family protein
MGSKRFSITVLITCLVTVSFYSRHFHGAILVYDVTNRETFQQLSHWHQTICQLFPKIPILLIGNKCDLTDLREVTRHEAQLFAQKYSIPFFAEVSAKHDIGIREAIQEFVIGQFCLLISLFLTSLSLSIPFSVSHCFSIYLSLVVCSDRISIHRCPSSLSEIDHTN